MKAYVIVAIICGLVFGLALSPYALEQGYPIDTTSTSTTLDASSNVGVNSVTSKNIAIAPYHRGTLTTNTVSINWSQGGWQSFTMLNSLTTLVSFTNVVTGGMYTLEITQGGIGNGLIAFASTVKTPNGTGIALANTGGGIDLIQLIYNGSLYYATRVPNMQ